MRSVRLREMKCTGFVTVAQKQRNRATAINIPSVSTESDLTPLAVV